MGEHSSLDVVNTTFFDNSPGGLSVDLYSGAAATVRNTTFVNSASASNIAAYNCIFSGGFVRPEPRLEECRVVSGRNLPRGHRAKLSGYRSTRPTSDHEWLRLRIRRTLVQSTRRFFMCYERLKVALDFGVMDKRAVFESIGNHLRAELATAQRLARETAAAANHPEARPENDKDTRKVELSYLAAGQAARAQELEVAIARLATLAQRAFTEDEALESGALIEIDMDGKSQCVLLSPVAGGLKLQIDGREIGVVTPQSPLGQGLLGRKVGESFELVVAGRTREVEIVRVE